MKPQEDTSKKKIDEDWKNKAEEEKFSPTEESTSAEVDFSNFILGLGMQALIALGEVPNPLTKKEEKEPGQAKYIIDSICLLREKTKGNLTAEENNLIDNLLYELQMKYVKQSRNQG